MIVKISNISTKALTESMARTPRPSRKSPTTRKKATSALEKAFRVIELIADQGALTVTQIERQVALPRATVHRVVNELTELGYLARDPVTRSHVEGRKLVKLSLCVMRSSTPHNRRRHIVSDLARDLGMSCYFGLLSGLRLTVLEQADASSPISVRLNGISELPAHATAGGKLLLAQRQDSEVAALLDGGTLVPHCEGTITDAQKLRLHLGEIRLAGYAFEDCEHLPGVVGIAVPVATRSGEIVGALGIAAHKASVDLGKAKSIESKLKAAARRLAATY